MQTFMPYSDINKSVRCLDWRRLGKQRVEAMQILNTILSDSKKGWKNHPAVKMWIGYEEALRLYMNACIDEWVRRGYNNSMIRADVEEATMPPWMGDEEVHAGYRSNLLRKDPEWYSQFGWEETDDLEYKWPV